MRATVPGQRVLDAVSRRFAPARAVRGKPVRRTGRRGDRESAGVRECARVVTRGLARRVAEVRAARIRGQPSAHFVDDVLGQHGPQGSGDERPGRDEVALVRRAGKPRIRVVQVVRRPLGRNGGKGPIQPVIGGEVVVEADGRLMLEELRGALPDIVVVERVALGGPSAGRLRRRVDLREQFHHRRVGRRDLAVGGRQLQQVDLAHFGAELVAEPAVVDPRIEDGARAREAVGEADLLVVEKEEGLVAAVVEAGDGDRTAYAPTERVQLDLVLRLMVDLVEDVVGVELGVPVGTS